MAVASVVPLDIENTFLLLLSALERGRKRRPIDCIENETAD